MTSTVGLDGVDDDGEDPAEAMLRRFDDMLQVDPSLAQAQALPAFTPGQFDDLPGEDDAQPNRFADA